MLYPVETLKIKRQIGDKRPMRVMFRTEWPTLYNGSGAAIARYVPGNFVLFGVHGAIMARYGTDGQKKSFSQHAIASIFAAWATIFVTNPMDVIKTRVQAYNGEISSLSMFKKTMLEEGWRALTKGIPIKLIMAGPKFILPLMMASYLPQMWESDLGQDKTEGTKSLPRK